MLAYMYNFISRILIRSPQMLAIPEICSLKPTDLNHFKVKLTQLSAYTHILIHTHMILYVLKYFKDKFIS